MSQIDIVLSTLNALDVGTMDSILVKLGQVQTDLVALEQTELAERAGDAMAALQRGDLAEFKRLRAFLQSKVGHLRR